MQRTCNEKFPTYSYCDLSTNKIIQEQLVKKVYYFIVNFVMFFIPIMIFFICYSMIIAKLYCSSSPGERIGGLMLFTEITRKLRVSIIRSDAPGQSQEESCQIGCSGYHYFRHVLVPTPGQYHTVPQTDGLFLQYALWYDEWVLSKLKRSIPGCAHGLYS